MIGNKQILADTSALAQSNKYNSINTPGDIFIY